MRAETGLPFGAQEAIVGDSVELFEGDFRAVEGLAAGHEAERAKGAAVGREVVSGIGRHVEAGAFEEVDGAWEVEGRGNEDDPAEAFGAGKAFDGVGFVGGYRNAVQEADGGGWNAPLNGSPAHRLGFGAAGGCGTQCTAAQDEARGLTGLNEPYTGLEAVDRVGPFDVGAAAPFGDCPAEDDDRAGGGAGFGGEAGIPLFENPKEGVGDEGRGDGNEHCKGRGGEPAAAGDETAEQQAEADSQWQNKVSKRLANGNRGQDEESGRVHRHGGEFPG